MKDYQVELQQVYEQMQSNGLVNSLLGVSMFLAIVLILRRIYKEYAKEEEKDYKKLLGITKQYIMITLFIVAFPLVLNKVEIILAGVQQNVSTHFNSSVEMTANEAIIKSIEDYAKKEDEYKGGEKSFVKEAIDFVGELSPLSGILGMGEMVGMMLNSLLLQINKYLYFFFCSGRYVWLLMLEIIAPLAIVCILDDETKVYFKSWLKNMTICYLLVPFFLLADVFGEKAIKVLASNSLIFSYSSYGVLAVIAMLILKISLYKVAANRAFKLVD